MGANCHLHVLIIVPLRKCPR